MEKMYGLLGEKLEHSYSPFIHSFLGFYTYSLFETNKNDLDKFMTQKDFDGINVTIPYKQAVIPYCAALSEEACLTGSVNTIIKDACGLLHGHNTDCHGFRVMLERGRIDPCKKKVLVLGSGGSAKTVRTVLAELGAREIVTISRRGENNYSNISRHYDAQIIVNTTPAGMFPDNGNSPLSLAGFNKLLGAADLIYNPCRTKFLLEAEQLGIPCVNGLSMLAAQAEMASRLFQNGSAQPELLEIIENAVKKETLNVALIGMPGCGKSTVGSILAQKLNRRFVDIDTEIEKHAGKSIPQIFREDGETIFRKYETRILADESKKSSLVIACGGGIVTRLENLDLLRQNSLIVYLERDLSELVTEGRPLSQSIGIESLAKQRLPLYKNWSNYTVQAEASPEITALKIFESLHTKSP